MAKIIDGKALAVKICGTIKSQITAKKAAPGLAVVLVGENPASKIYVKNKIHACKEAGIKSFDHILPEAASEDELLKLIKQLNQSQAVHGILVQLPLPKHIDTKKILAAIDSSKDIDGFHPENLGKLLCGEKGPRPCTPLGIMELIDSIGYDLGGKNAVVVGRSTIVGKPIAIMLLERNATVTVCHSKTKNLAEIIKCSDIVVSAIGRPEFIKGDWIKDGAVVIDVGINRMADGKLLGDVEFDSANQRAGWITPVPGGVGPMTVAMLLKNTFSAYLGEFK